LWRAKRRGVSTLLEILPAEPLYHWLLCEEIVSTLLEILRVGRGMSEVDEMLYKVSTLLEILPLVEGFCGKYRYTASVSTLLEILPLAFVELLCF